MNDIIRDVFGVAVVVALIGGAWWLVFEVWDAPVNPGSPVSATKVSVDSLRRRFWRWRKSHDLSDRHR